MSSVGDSTVLVVKADSYPFNVLTSYGEYISGDDGNETVIKDLSYILTKLPEKDRTALIAAVSELIANAGAGVSGS